MFLWTACQKLTTPLDYKLVKAAGSSKDAIEKAMSDVKFVGDQNDELLEIGAMSLKAFLALGKKNEKLTIYDKSEGLFGEIFIESIDHML